jgi:hypothetical protein
MRIFMVGDDAPTFDTTMHGLCAGFQVLEAIYWHKKHVAHSCLLADGLDILEYPVPILSHYYVLSGCPSL